MLWYTCFNSSLEDAAMLFSKCNGFHTSFTMHCAAVREKERVNPFSSATSTFVSDDKYTNMWGKMSSNAEILSTNPFVRRHATGSFSMSSCIYVAVQETITVHVYLQMIPPTTTQKCLVFSVISVINQTNNAIITFLDLRQNQVIMCSG